ncbi:MAG: hypothetical protein ACRDBO_15045 [Lachnospiraceae bacterium]
MRWYKHLYVGEKAKHRRYDIIRHLREEKIQSGIHVITPPQNGNNVLDIYPSFMLFLPPYHKQNLLILGIAADYWEALEVVRIIVDDMYQKTGDFRLEALFEKEKQ